MLPVYMAKAGGFFFVVFGFTALMGALIQINPVWAYGPYNPSEVTAGSQPDWYMGLSEGLVRLMPPLETTWFNRTWTLERLPARCRRSGHPVHLAGPVAVHRAVDHRRQA